MAVTVLLWVAAIGSRHLQLVPIGFITVLICIEITLRARASRSFGELPAVFTLVSSLGLGLAILSWYNWARFNSVFETGFDYALAGPDLQKYHKFLFSAVYVVQNLFVYFLNPLKLGYAFPFLSPIVGVNTSIVPFFNLPKIYHSQDSTGILFTSPFTLLAILPLISIFLKPSKNLIKDDQPVVRWLIIALAGSYLSALFVYCAFFWVAERYVADFIPCLALLGIIGFWQLDQYFAARPRIRILYWILGISLIVISIIVSSLIALSINSAELRTLNPILWRQLSNLFRHQMP